MKKQFLLLTLITTLLSACASSPQGEEAASLLPAESSHSNVEIDSAAEESVPVYPALSSTEESITPFTEETAFAYLKESQEFTDDILLDHSVYYPEENYYELKLISKSLRKNGGSGTVGIYQVFEDGTIIDTYAD